MLFNLLSPLRAAGIGGSLLALGSFKHLSASSTTMASDPKKAANIYGFTANDIDGNAVSLDKYQGHVCIVVNVASK